MRFTHHSNYLFAYSSSFTTHSPITSVDQSAEKEMSTPQNQRCERAFLCNYQGIVEDAMMNAITICEITTNGESQSISVSLC